VSTPENGDQPPWQQPGQPPAGSGYGQPSSPSYGKYGQGQAVPPTAPAPPPGQQFPGRQPPGQQPPGGAWGQPTWGQPGYVAPQPWVNRPTTLRSAGGLPTAVLLLSALMAVALCLIAYLAPNQHQAIRDALNGVPARSRTGSSLYQVLSPLGFLAEVCVWVVTCVWLTRARQNALVLQPDGRQRRAEAWIWLGWILPVINFWFPKQVVDDVIGATAAGAGVPRLRTGLWWAAWLGSVLLGGAQAALSLYPPNDSLHRAIGLTEAIVTVVGLVLWIRIVRWISGRQEALVADRPVATLQG
jgi:hypothetical protein